MAQQPEAATQPYFYECFFDICQKKIPFGPKYREWAAEMRELMENGKEIYYLGRRRSERPRDSAVG
jgi:hypothetical protein